MRRSHAEDGAIAVMVSLLICFLMMPLASVALDLGMQRVARQDMQSLSDVVALDLSRDIDGLKSAAVILAAWGCQVSADASCTGAPTNRVGDSADRNTSTVGAVPSVTAWLGCTDAVGAFKKIGELVEVGETCDVPRAVKVDSETSVDFNLTSGSGGAARSAIGTSKRTACFHLGSFAARITGDSSLVAPLDNLIGADLDLVSYQGLAVADVTLADLAASSHIGGVDQLLGGGITLRDVLSATYEVLNTQGEPENTVALNLLNNPAAWLGANLDAVVDLGKLLNVSTTDTAALSTDFSVLDLLAGSIGVANGESALSLDKLGLLGLTDATKSYVKVIQGLQTGCGKADDPDPVRGYAKASQVRARLEGDLSKLGGGLGLGSLGLGITTASGNYVIKAEVGGSEGKLIGADGVAFPSVHCASGSAVDPDKLNVRITNGLASASAELTVNLKGDTGNPGSVVSVPLVTDLVNGLLTVQQVDKLLNVTYDLQVKFSAATNTTPSTGIAHLQVPQNSLGNERAEPPLPDGTPVTLGSTSALQVPVLAAPTVTGTITVTSSLLSLLGVPVGQRTDTIPIDVSRLPMVQPLADAVSQQVHNNESLASLTSGLNSTLTSLGDLLGVKLGGADVFAKYRPECHGAELIG